MNNLVDKKSKIIDIGTGNGQFIKLLLTDGFKEVSAFEIPGSDLTQIEQLSCTVYRDFDYQSIPSNTFDVVTLIDVAEHVINPKYMFKSCNRVLKEGGVIYLHTPVVTKIDRMMHYIQKVPMIRKVGESWQRGRTSVFHLQNYTSKSLIMLLYECGFDYISSSQKNELSWPVSRYIRVYLFEKLGLPGFMAPLFVPFFYAVLASDFFNSNKAVVWANKCYEPLS